MSSVVCLSLRIDALALHQILRPLGQHTRFEGQQRSAACLDLLAIAVVTSRLKHGLPVDAWSSRVSATNVCRHGQ